MATVALIGTLDTKGDECSWLVQRLRELDVGAFLIDTGSFSTSELADISSNAVIEAAGADPVAVQSRRDRGEMTELMGRGAATIVTNLAKEGKIHGFLAIGGSGGSSIAAPAMQSLPIGFPKLLVSTMASGDVKPYVGAVDSTLMYSVVDVAGINSISSMVLGNAAAAIAGMARGYERRQTEPDEDAKPLVGMTMFGVTTPACTEARQRLSELGYEVLTFHATGTGGQAMEKLVASGQLAGVCDLTTTELADDLVGGVLTAGPHRLEAAGAKGVPQVVSLGALDMVNFGPMDTVPPQFADRRLYVHNPTVTLMRTTPGEMTELGRRIATKLAAAAGPTELFIPLRGVSAIDVDGAPFRDADADDQLFTVLRNALATTPVVVHEIDLAINDPGFGSSMADALHRLIIAKRRHEASPSDEQNMAVQTNLEQKENNEYVSH